MIDNYLATNGGGIGKSGYTFNATGSASAASPINDQFYSTATPITWQFGTRAYCSIQDVVIASSPPATSPWLAAITPAQVFWRCNNPGSSDGKRVTLYPVPKKVKSHCL